MKLTSETHVWYKVDRESRTLFKSDTPRPGFDPVPRENAAYQVEECAIDIFRYQLKVV